jgi:hypothetical protein
VVFVLPIRRYNPPFLEANTITFLTPETGSLLDAVRLPAVLALHPHLEGSGSVRGVAAEAPTV